MIFNLSSVVDWRAITLRKQKQVDRDNLRENAKRISYDYAVGNQIYIKQEGIARKLDDFKEGPYQITQVFTNGTVRIQRGAVNERIHIRRLEPHFD